VRTSSSDERSEAIGAARADTSYFEMRSAIVMLVVVATAALAACTPVPPWARGPLTHPTMTPDELSQGLDGHVRAVSEGAAGGLAGGGGGCGCN
jgi:hypothetical protein